MKPLATLVGAPVVMTVLVCQSVQAGPQVSGQSASALTGPGTTMSGQTILAANDGINVGPEALRVNWVVTEVAPGSYLYDYTAYNDGAMLLPPNSGPEEFDLLNVGFDTTPGNGNYLASSGGLNGGVPLGPFGVTWDLLAVYGGQNSGDLQVISANPPTDGFGTASDSVPPSPWSSLPDGGYFPVPGVPGSAPFSIPDGGYYNPNGQKSAVPDSTSTMALLGGMMMLLPFRSAFRNRK